MNEQYIERVKIYSGPISLVYRAKDRDSGSVVALKIVDVDFVVKPHNIKKEIEFLKREQSNALQHGILQYLNTYKHVDDEVIVTEYYDIDLSSLIEQYRKRSVKYNWDNPSENKYVYKNQFPLEMAGHIFYKLSETLSYLHDKCEIIHRDIKPSNVFFKYKHGTKNEIGDPVLGDFGIIYDKRAGNSEEQWDTKYTDVSTGVYKAPELCFGKSDYDTSIDIWSLGVLVSKIYSNDGIECLGEYTSDLGLIDSIFLHFGTPTTTITSDKNYWNEMKGNSQFDIFQFKQFPRMNISKLLPRCEDENIMTVWNNIMIYESSSRLRANEIVENLLH